MRKLFKSVIALMVALSAVGCCASECGPKKECSKEEAVIETIMTRRSIRSYKEEPVCREQMAKIVQCGIYAPSAMNMQPWAVRVVDSKEFIDGVTAVALQQNPKMGEQEGFRNFFRNAPTVVFVACPEVSYSGEYDSGLLSQNMMLAAWSMGVGSCCLGSVVPVMASEEAKPYLEMLQLPEGYKLLVAIAFGYPDCEIPEAPERDATKVMFL